MGGNFFSFFIEATWYRYNGILGEGGGHSSFQNTGWCHSNHEGTARRSGEISKKYADKSGKFSENQTHKSGNAEKAHQ